MNKKSMVAKFLLVVGIIGILGAGFSGDVLAAKYNYNVNYNNNFIGEAKAKEIALNHAGVNEAEVGYIKIELEREKTGFEYDIEFYKDNVKYEYDINAVNGNIVKFEKKIKNIPSKPEKPSTEVPGKEAVDAGKAKEITLDYLGFTENEVNFKKVKLENKKGYSQYKVELYKGNNKYELKIDAANGNIFEYEWELKTKQYYNMASPVISEAKAKEIALNHVGFTENEVIFKKAKLERSKKKVEYDVEFYKGNIKYEFDINAVTGEVYEYQWKIDRNLVGQEEVSNYITIEKATEIALNHAGYDLNSVRFSEREFDMDKGRALFEIEFYVNNYKYEYKVDAISGEILKVEKEYKRY